MHQTGFAKAAQATLSHLLAGTGWVKSDEHAALLAFEAPDIMKLKTVSSCSAAFCS